MLTDCAELRGRQPPDKGGGGGVTIEAKRSQVTAGEKPSKLKLRRKEARMVSVQNCGYGSGDQGRTDCGEQQSSKDFSPSFLSPFSPSFLPLSSFLFSFLVSISLAKSRTCLTGKRPVEQKQVKTWSQGGKGRMGREGCREAGCGRGGVPLSHLARGGKKGADADEPGAWGQEPRTLSLHSF